MKKSINFEFSIIRNYIKTSKEHKNFNYSRKKIRSLENLVKKSSLNNPEENEKKSLAINMKIFVNYTQMIGIISQFDLQWPYRVKDVVVLQSNLSALSNQLFFLDCLLKSYKIFKWIIIILLFLIISHTNPVQVFTI